jgi:diphthine synthase
VGLGLGGPEELSERAVAELRAAQEVFVESFTTVVPPDELDRLEELLGRRVRRLDRAAVETGEEILRALASGGRVVLLTGGDPFAATTHVALRLRARALGHAWSYLPATSVVTAVPGFLGLQQYRFGRTVSIPFPAPGFAPSSFLDQIASNRAADLHTLVLLDLDPATGRVMTATEAFGILLERERSHPVDPSFATVACAVAARVGRPDAGGYYGPVPVLARTQFGAPPHAIVVPAPNLHFQEAEALEEFRVPAG